MMADAAYDIATSDLSKELLTSVGPGAVLRDFYEVTTGHSLIDNRTLEPWERGVALFSIATGGVGSKLFKAAGAADRVAGMGVMLKRLIKESDASEKIIEVAAREARAIKEAKRFGPLEKGPLHSIREGNGHVSDTFRSGSYTQIVTQEEKILYRVYGSKAEDGMGRYWSEVAPSGPYQATLDVAITPEFNNDAKKWVKITLPKGTTIYRGAASPQILKAKNTEVKVGELLGGGDQIYIEYETISKLWNNIKKQEDDF
jgi:hypothetical protein